MLSVVSSYILFVMCCSLCVALVCYVVFVFGLLCLVLFVLCSTCFVLAVLVFLNCLLCGTALGMEFIVRCVCSLFIVCWLLLCVRCSLRVVVRCSWFVVCRVPYFGLLCVLVVVC